MATFRRHEDALLLRQSTTVLIRHSRGNRFRIRNAMFCWRRMLEGYFLWPPPDGCPPPG